MEAAQRTKPGILLGVLLGALFTLPLMAVQFVGYEIAGLPYLPFDSFDWLSRTLPGGLITFGIDAMVELLLALGVGANLDAAAKLSEQLMAQALYIGTGALGGGLLFFILRRRSHNTESTGVGLFFGLVMAIPFALIIASAPLAPLAGVPLGVLWTLIVYAAFGVALHRAYNALVTTQDVQSDAAITTTPLDRRQFLIRAGGATAAITVIGAGLGGVLRLMNQPESVPGGSTVDENIEGNGQMLQDGSGNPLPNADDPVAAAPGTRQEYTPLDEHYRIDILSGRLPDIPEDYTLPITGLVENPVEWTLDDIRDMPNMTEFITMSCISNRIGGSLISTTKWTGVSFQHILEQIQPDESAAALRITGADDFDEYIELDKIREDERIMLVYAFDDQPLPLRNGFPLRTHIPNHYGMKQPKWITGIEVVDSWAEGYWVRRGWSRDAVVRATSVIDTVADQAIYDEGGTMFVPIGGIAWAGDRGISRVQVRVDEGEWQDAQLRSPMSDRAWTIWRYDWQFEEGTHRFEVVCYDGNGDMQITEVNGVRPDGATGIHSVREAFNAPA